MSEAEVIQRIISLEKQVKILHEQEEISNVVLEALTKSLKKNIADTNRSINYVISRRNDLEAKLDNFIAGSRA